MCVFLPIWNLFYEPAVASFQPVSLLTFPAVRWNHSVRDETSINVGVGCLGPSPQPENIPELDGFQLKRHFPALVIDWLEPHLWFINEMVKIELQPDFPLCESVNKFVKSKELLEEMMRACAHNHYSQFVWKFRKCK